MSVILIESVGCDNDEGITVASVALADGEDATFEVAARFSLGGASFAFGCHPLMIRGGLVRQEHGNSGLARPISYGLRGPLERRAAGRERFVSVVFGAPFDRLTIRQ